jgi:hypothetical protein
MRKIWLFLIIGILATPLLWLLGAFLSGGGHNYAMMIVTFPWGMLLDLSFEGLSWWAIGMPVFAIQFPLYGLLLGYAREKRRLVPCLIALSAMHVLAVLLCFAIDPKSSWKLFM